MASTARSHVEGVDIGILQYLLVTKSSVLLAPANKAANNVVVV